MFITFHYKHILTFLILSGCFQSSKSVNIEDILKAFANIGLNEKDIKEYLKDILGAIRDKSNAQGRAEGGGGIPIPAVFGTSPSGRTCGPPPDDPVTQNLDLCIILQTSCHIPATEIQKAIDAIYTILNRFGSDVWVTLVTYDEVAKVKIPFQVNSADVLSAVDKLSTVHTEKKLQGSACKDCAAATDDALEICRDILHGEDARDDRFYPNGIIVFNDGVTLRSKFTLPRDRQRTLDQALLNKNSDIISVVSQFSNGEGSWGGAPEWDAISSHSPILGVTRLDPAPLDNGDGPPFGGGGGGGPPSGGDGPPFNGGGGGPPPNVPVFSPEDTFRAFPGCADPCKQFADVQLVIDRSDSIPTENIQDMVDFFKFFINNSNVDYYGGLQFGVYTYNADVFTHSPLGLTTTKEDLMTVLDTIPIKTGKYTNTAKAIVTATRDLVRGARLGVAKRVILLCTDGKNWLPGAPFTDPRPVVAAAKWAKEEHNIEIYILGLPNFRKRFGVNEWIRVASEPTGCHIVNMQTKDFTFEHLYLAGIMLSNELCKAKLGASACPFSETQAVPEGDATLP